jgi:hypothetical protein
MCVILHLDSRLHARLCPSLIYLVLKRQQAHRDASNAATSRMAGVGSLNMTNNFTGSYGEYYDHVMVQLECRICTLSLLAEFRIFQESCALAVAQATCYCTTTEAVKFFKRRDAPDHVDEAASLRSLTISTTEGRK